MSESEFWGSTLRWYSAKRAAYVRHQQAEWERTRLLAFYMVKTVDSKNRVKSPKGLFALPWEREHDRLPAPSAADLAALEQFDREADEYYYTLYPERRPQPQDGKS